MTGLWDEMSSSTEYNLIRQKFKAMTLFEFLDKHPLPTNSKEVEEQISEKTFHFLHSLNPNTLQKKSFRLIGLRKQVLESTRHYSATHEIHRRVSLRQKLQ